MLLLKPLIVKHITNGVIAPHGITDMLHARCENKMKELTLTYGTTIVSSYLLSDVGMGMAVNMLFFMLSVVHFRRDMPIIKNIPRYIWSFLFLQYATTSNIELFFLYMVCLHVPNHYRLNWNYIKQNGKMSAVVIIGATVFLDWFGRDTYDLVVNDGFMSIAKGIVMSHVIYDEFFIFNDEKIDD